MTETWCPFARIERAPYDNGSHGGPINTPVLGVVDHITTNEFDPGGFFANPNSQASSTMWIAEDGTLVQFLPLEVASWAQAAGNYSYWSIEVAGLTGTPMNAAQIATFGRAYGWLQSQPGAGFGFTATDTPGQYGLIGHGDGGASWGGHYDCPGSARLAQRPQILAIAEDAPPPTPEDDMPRAITCTDPLTGGTWEVLTDDGEVDTDDGAPYLGGLNNHPEWTAMDPAHPIVAVEPWHGDGTNGGGNGYKIGEYDPNPPAGHGRVRWYRFPRDARYAVAK